MNGNKKIDLIYDGQYLFCIMSLKLFGALDVKDVLRFYYAHDKGTKDEKLPELVDAAFDNAMFAITENRETFREFYTFRGIAWSSPLTWVLIL